MNRVMAKVVKIDSVGDIAGADSIECAKVGGWNVVVKKGEYSAGDLAVYCEIDSWIPHDLAPFLSKGQEPKEYNGVKGNRLRTAKLRGQLSQGLLLSRYSALDNVGEIHVGMDCTNLLGIQKYDPPMPAQLAGEAVGLFPSFIQKTDQERIQNLVPELDTLSNNHRWEVTEKLDGSSITVFLNQGEFGVCSRNLQLRETEGNSFWKVVRHFDIEAKMRSLNLDGIAIQGELVGEGIQGNPYKIKGQTMYVFDIFNIKEGGYCTGLERVRIVNALGLNHVPIIINSFVLDQFEGNVDNILEYADGKSAIADCIREGVVFKSCNTPDVSFKAISNRFLLKEK